MKLMEWNEQKKKEPTKLVDALLCRFNEVLLPLPLHESMRGLEFSKFTVFDVQIIDSRQKLPKRNGTSQHFFTIDLP